MDKNKNIFTQREVNAIFSLVPVKTLRWWGIMGLYGWTEEIADGRGISRQYELANLYQIGLVEQLTDLNVPIAVIRNTMTQHFYSGLRMKEMDNRPPVKISEQMDKLLVIEKTFKGDVSFDAFNYKEINWTPLLVEIEEFRLSSADKSITIVIKLKAIKEYVDSLIEIAGP